MEDKQRALREKMATNRDIFVKGLAPTALIQHARKIAVLDEIQKLFEHIDLTEAETDYLLTLDRPAEAVYEAWCEIGFSITQELRDAVDLVLDRMM